MSLLTPAIRRRAFEQGSADALFRRKGVHQGSRRGCSACPQGRNPSNFGQIPAEEPAKGPDQEMTQGAPGSHNQMIWTQFQRTGGKLASPVVILGCSTSRLETSFSIEESA